MGPGIQIGSYIIQRSPPWTEWQTRVETLPCPKLRLRAVKITNFWKRHYSHKPVSPRYYVSLSLASVASPVRDAEITYGAGDSEEKKRDGRHSEQPSPAETRHDEHGQQHDEARPHRPKYLQNNQHSDSTTITTATAYMIILRTRHLHL